MALLPGDDGPYIFESEFPQAAAGLPVLDYLAGRFAYQGRDVWEARIRGGDVLLDGRILSNPDEPLPASGRVAYIHGAYEEPDVPTDWRILYSARDWLAIEKPAGMPVHSTPRIFRQTLTWQVRKLCGTDWSPVHRLDRDTSGLVLFARGESMLPRLGARFSQRRVEKTYLALVKGSPMGDFEIDAPLGKVGDPSIPLRVGARPDGKEARTTARVLGSDVLGRGTWIEVSPHQGRLHQIRVHMEHAGFPILGDLLYDGQGGLGYLARAAGASAEAIEALSGSSRMWLHALALRFPEPEAGMPERLECPLEGVAWRSLDESRTK